MSNKGWFIGAIGIALISVSLMVPSIGAERHMSMSGCASCQLDEPQPRTTKQLGQCLEFIQVELGQKTHILKANGSQFVGTWEADFGKIQEDGTYIAPRNIAAPGVDHIRFSGAESPAAASFTVLVQLMPSTRTPDPASEQLDIVDVEEVDVAYTLPEIPRTGFDRDNSNTVYQMLNPATIEPLTATAVGSQTGYIVPVIHNPGSSENVAMVYAYSTTPQVGKTCGVFPKPTGSCTGNETKIVKGPVKMDRKPWANRSNQFEVTAKLSVKLGIDIGVKVTVRYKLREVTAYCYKDVYQFVSRAWNYSHTEICRSRGLEWANIDPAYGVWFLFPTTGINTIVFDPWNCETYEK